MQRLGFGAIETIEDGISLLAHGLIAHPRDPNVSYNAHLNSGIEQIVQDLPRVIDMTRPDLICAETVPPGRLGSNTELVVAAITTCKVVAFQFGIGWHDIGANSVKKIVAGDGAASKVKIRNSVFNLFPTIEERHKLLKLEQKEAGEKATGLPADVFDAVAIALAGASLYDNSNTEEESSTS